MIFCISVDPFGLIPPDLKVFNLDSQITHKLSRDNPFEIVNNLCTKFMLLTCNGKNMAVWGLVVAGFLPTMKFQLSQLP